MQLKGLLIAILMLGTALRWFELGHRGLWWDELFSVVSSSRSETLSALWSDWMVSDSHPPGFQLLLWVWFKIFPDTELWARVPSALASTLALFYAAFATRHVLSLTGRTLLTSLLAFSYLTVYYAQEARQYAMVMMLSLVCTDLALRLCRGEGSWAHWARFGVVAVCTAYIHYFGLFLVGLWFVILGITTWRNDGWNGLKRWGCTSVGLGLAYIPGTFTLHHLVDTGNGGWQRRKETQKFLKELYEGYFINDWKASTGMLVVLAGISIFGWWRWKRRQKASIHPPFVPLVMVLVLAVVVVAWADQYSPVLQVRYYLVFLAPLLILISGTVSWCLQAAPVRLRGLVALMPVVGLVVWYPTYRDYPKQGWREATEWVVEHHEADDFLAVLGPSDALNAGQLLEAGLTNQLFWLRNHNFFQYYFDRYPDEPQGNALVRIPNVKPRGEEPKLIEIENPDRIFFLAGHHLRLSKPFKNHLKKRYLNFRIVKFKSTRVYVFDSLKVDAVREN